MKALWINECCVVRFRRTAGVTKNMEVVNGGEGKSSHAGRIEGAPARGDVGEYRHKDMGRSLVEIVQEVLVSETAFEGVLYRTIIAIQECPCATICFWAAGRD